MPRLASIALVLASCGGAVSAPPGAIDCGTSDLRQADYDSKAVECFWQTYTTGHAVVAPSPVQLVNSKK